MHAYECVQVCQEGGLGTCSRPIYMYVCMYVCECIQVCQEGEFGTWSYIHVLYTCMCVRVYVNGTRMYAYKLVQV